MSQSSCYVKSKKDDGCYICHFSILDLAYGSVFTLKQRRTGGAYLHSHWHLYPEEHPPQQQQVAFFCSNSFIYIYISSLG